MHHQIVAMQRQLLSAEQTSPAQKDADIALAQQGRIVEPANDVSALPRRTNQLWERAVEPAAAITEQGEAEPGAIASDSRSETMRGRLRQALNPA